MSNLILPTHIAKARKKQKATKKKELTAAEIEKKQKEVEGIYG